jgi:hypothetical protein
MASHTVRTHTQHALAKEQPICISARFKNPQEDISEAALPVNVLDLGEHQLQAAKKDDVGRLIKLAGVIDIFVEAVALHNGPAAGSALSVMPILEQ